jgi:hypothetical protein
MNYSYGTPLFTRALESTFVDLFASLKWKSLTLLYTDKQKIYLSYIKIMLLHACCIIKLLKNPKETIHVRGKNKNVGYSSPPVLLLYTSD